ncbi:MAG: polysaccharide lyase family 1 protein, partial [Pirellulales bacterium]
PFEVLVDGKPLVSGIRPSKRVTSEGAAASAFVEFEATDGKGVIVEIRTESSSTDRRTILNGLEIDTVDPTKKATAPAPLAGDEHVAARPTLSWKAAKSATAHEVYFGTDPAAVAAATPNSAESRGRQTATEFTSDAVDPSVTYYWRVDEVAGKESSRVTKGDVWSFRVRQLAFPGAEGYGRFARGGRGGRVIEVTNLNDSGPGSLRAAVEAEGPRTVVFNVGGLITLESKLIIHNPYLSIAGQTAPGKGICIRKYNMGVGGSHDIIIRYVRVRPGNIAGVTLDGMGLAGTDHSIIDHCSISWTQDESFSSRAAKNITFQRNLISEALNIAGHKNYEKGKQHGYAASIGGDVGSFHHNLLAHCAGRNWSLAGGLDKAGRHTGRLDIRNNVVYNWGHRTTDGGVHELNYVNNYYKPGPASEVFHVLMPERDLVHAFGPQDYYVEGNVMEGHYGADQPLQGVRGQRHEPIEDFIVDKPFFESYVSTQSADEAYEDVLADVGCNVPALDTHDQRVIEETRAGTAAYKGSVSGIPGLPDKQDDVGGWENYPEAKRDANWDTDHDGLPNAWEVSHQLNPNSAAGDFGEANADLDGDGFTNLEDYLNSLTVRP